MKREKNLTHGNIKVTILDDDLDVASEQPGPAKDTAGFTKIWVVADIYVFKKGTITSFKFNRTFVTPMMRPFKYSLS